MWSVVQLGSGLQRAPARTSVAGSGGNDGGGCGTGGGGAVPTSRSKHAMCVGQDGYFYMLGGKSANLPMKDLWRFDPGKNEWDEVESRGGTAPPSLQEHTVVSWKSKLYVFGGEIGFASTGETPLWVFDIITGIWHKHLVQGPQPSGRRGHSTVVYNGAMHLYGGYQDLKGSSSELWSFHFDTGTWQLVSSKVKGGCGDVPSGRHSHSAVVHDGAMWVFGGMTDLRERSDFWRYDFVNQHWNRIKIMKGAGPRELHSHAAVFANQCMWIFGGEKAGKPSNDLWRYHFATDTWDKIQAEGVLPNPRCRHVALANPQLHKWADKVLDTAPTPSSMVARLPPKSQSMMAFGERGRANSFKVHPMTRLGQIAGCASAMPSTNSDDDIGDDREVDDEPNDSDPVKAYLAAYNGAQRHFAANRSLKQRLSASRLVRSISSGSYNITALGKQPEELERLLEESRHNTPQLPSKLQRHRVGDTAHGDEESSLRPRLEMAKSFSSDAVLESESDGGTPVHLRRLVGRKKLVDLAADSTKTRPHSEIVAASHQIEVLRQRQEAATGMSLRLSPPPASLRPSRRLHASKSMSFAQRHQAGDGGLLTLTLSSSVSPVAAEESVVGVQAASAEFDPSQQRRGRQSNIGEEDILLKAGFSPAAHAPSGHTRVQPAGECEPDGDGLRSPRRASPEGAAAAAGDVCCSAVLPLESAALTSTATTTLVRSWSPAVGDTLTGDVTCELRGFSNSAQTTQYGPLTHVSDVDTSDSEAPDGNSSTGGGGHERSVKGCREHLLVELRKNTTPLSRSTATELERIRFYSATAAAAEAAGSAGNTASTSSRFTSFSTLAELNTMAAANKERPRMPHSVSHSSGYYSLAEDDPWRIAGCSSGSQQAGLSAGKNRCLISDKHASVVCFDDSKESLSAHDRFTSTSAATATLVSTNVATAAKFVSATAPASCTTSYSSTGDQTVTNGRAEETRYSLNRTAAAGGKFSLDATGGLGESLELRLFSPLPPCDAAAPGIAALKERAKSWDRASQRLNSVVASGHRKAAGAVGETEVVGANGERAASNHSYQAQNYAATHAAAETRFMRALPSRALAIQAIAEESTHGSPIRISSESWSLHNDDDDDEGGDDVEDDDDDDTATGLSASYDDGGVGDVDNLNGCQFQHDGVEDDDFEVDDRGYGDTHHHDASDASDDMSRLSGLSSGVGPVSVNGTAASRIRAGQHDVNGMHGGGRTSAGIGRLASSESSGDLHARPGDHQHRQQRRKQESKTATACARREPQYHQSSRQQQLQAVDSGGRARNIHHVNAAPARYMTPTKGHDEFNHIYHQQQEQQHQQLLVLHNNNNSITSSDRCLNRGYGESRVRASASRSVLSGAEHSRPRVHNWQLCLYVFGGQEASTPGMYRSPMTVWQLYV